MNLKEKTAILGLGCYGGKQAKEFISTYGYKGSAANGSDQDLKALGGSITKYHLEGFDGFGGHRDKALECLQENGEFLDYVEAIKEQIVFLIFAGGGSTGSGCAPIVAELLMQKPGRIVCPVIALPSSDEAIDKHSNAYQAVQELQELDGLGATFFINNDVERDYDNINTTFAKLLDTFLTNDSYGERNNFDESERLEMLRDSGAMVLSLHKSGTDQTAMVDKLIRNGIFAPIEDTQVVEHIQYVKKSVIYQNGKYALSDFYVPDTQKYIPLLQIYNGKLNTNFSQKKNGLSVTWFNVQNKTNIKTIRQLKNNLNNYFRNILNAKSETILWTTFKDYKIKLRGKGYSKEFKAKQLKEVENAYGFLACNARATNKYAKCYNLAYCVNIYMHPAITQFFAQKGIKVDEDLYALSEMIQWIWRSQIRNGEKINIYIPSTRMRLLLKSWLDMELDYQQKEVA